MKQTIETEKLESSSSEDQRRFWLEVLPAMSDAQKTDIARQLDAARKLMPYSGKGRIVELQPLPAAHSSASEKASK